MWATPLTLNANLGNRVGTVLAWQLLPSYDVLRAS